MHITKKDLLTIVVLSIVFFAVAAWNLGNTQAPVTTTQVFTGQTFYVDLGTSTTVKAVITLIKDGSSNLTLSVGSPDNWQIVSNDVFSYNSQKQQWSGEYYKWHEINCMRLWLR